MNPGGPTFTDQTLAILASDETPWKSYSEHRASILTLVEASVRESADWPGFENSELKQSIHRNAQILLSKFPISKVRQREVVSIFNRLQLWDETDLPFLMKKFFNRNSLDSQTSEFLKWFDKGSPELKSEFADRVRRTQKKELLEYTVLYRHDLINDDEIIWLFRLFMSDFLFEGIAQDNQQVEALFNWVLKDLHLRLRQGDARIVSAYDQVRASPNWTGNQFGKKQNLEAMNRFLRDLWTGRLLTDCETALAPVPGPGKPLK